MAGQQVTLTLAGDASQLTKAFDQVGQSAKKMSDDVGSASKGFDAADKASGNLERAGRGLRDAFTGTQDTMKGVGGLLKGDFSAETFLLVGAGVADLGGAFGDLIIPLAKGTAGFIAHNAAIAAHAVVSGVAKAATVTWTGVQWLLNAALTANPIGLIVVGIGLLIAAIVLIATKTTWFQDIWNAAWGWIKNTAMNVWDWLKSLPDKIGDAFSRIAGFISAPFRAAFNFVSDAWNNTIGKLRWTVPSWVPFVGGNSISAPTLPKFHTGGIVPGMPGQEVLGLLKAGETVVPAGALESAAREALDRISSNGFIYEDLSFAGYSQNLRKWNDELMQTLKAGGFFPKGYSGPQTRELYERALTGFLDSEAGQSRGGSIALTIFLDGRDITASVRSQVKSQGGNVQVVLGR